jgi:hypothetical protein
VGDNQAWLFQVLVDCLKKRGNPVIKVIETFSPRGSERFNFFSPFFKEIGIGFLDMIKGFAVPGAQVDFIEPYIHLDFFPRADKVSRVLASQKAAGINFFKLYVGKGFFPEQGLVLASLIQGDICLADESFSIVSLDLPVTQQV